MPLRRSRPAAGTVDALVNNAGIINRQCRADEMDAALLAEIFVHNTFKRVYATREALKRMSTKHGGKGGAIVTISSAAARHGGLPMETHYAASKGALKSTTVGLAKEVGKEGVRVNAIGPGSISRPPSTKPMADRRTLEAVGPTVPIGRAVHRARNRRSGAMAGVRRSVVRPRGHPGRHGRPVAPPGLRFSGRLHRIEGLPGLAEIRLQFQRVVERVRRLEGVARFCVGQAQVIAVDGVLRVRFHARLQRPDGERRQVLLVVHPPQRVVDSRLVGHLLRRRRARWSATSRFSPRSWRAMPGCSPPAPRRGSGQRQLVRLLRFGRLVLRLEDQPDHRGGGYRLRLPFRDALVLRQGSVELALFDVEPGQTEEPLEVGGVGVDQAPQHGLLLRGVAQGLVRVGVHEN